MVLDKLVKMPVLFSQVICFLFLLKELGGLMEDYISFPKYVVCKIFQQVTHKDDKLLLQQYNQEAEQWTR